MFLTQPDRVPVCSASYGRNNSYFQHDDLLIRIPNDLWSLSGLLLHYSIGKVNARE